ncbi:MAG: FkbM family methyltransferase [Pseudomonadales bacterium]|nr:FkbM family methyltransferase [Pseudomonadales bacterium]
MILRRLFENRPNGFYIDVGSHHPKRFSNTYFFYKRGWHGINIDAMPGSMKLFEKFRPRDTNLEVGVGSNSGMMNFHIFNEPALSGFSHSLSEERDKASTNYSLLKIQKIEVKPLADILDKQLPKGQTLDFLSVDVEGLDLEVLQSNNWTKYRPEIVLVEILKNNFNELNKDPVGQFMQQKNYQPIAKCMNTVLFRRNDTIA